jgi:hypothetical protein
MLLGCFFMKTEARSLPISELPINKEGKDVRIR